MREADICPLCRQPLPKGIRSEVLERKQQAQVAKEAQKRTAGIRKQISEQMEHQYLRRMEHEKTMWQKDSESALRSIQLELAAAEKEKKQIGKLMTRKLKEEATQGEKKLKLRVEQERGKAAAREQELRKRMEAERKQLQKDSRAELASLQKNVKAAKKEKEQLERQIGKEIAAARREAQKEAQETVDEEKLKSHRAQMRLHNEVDKLREKLSRRSLEDVGADAEKDLALVLRKAFPSDRITRRKGRGIRADVLHQVVYREQVAGLIVYESKKVKRWESKFINQAKSYRDKYGTNHVVIVSATMARGESYFFVGRERRQEGGVPVVHPALVVHFASVLREFIVSAKRTELERTEAEAKEALLYEYFSGDEFKRSMTTTKESIDKLKDVIERERYQHERWWNERVAATAAVEKFNRTFGARTTNIIEGRAVPRKRREIARA